MRIAFGIGTLFASGGLQRDCLSIARLVREQGHEVTLFAEGVSGTIDTGGIVVTTLPNNASSNHGRQQRFAADFLKASAAHDLKVGFNKLLGLDVLYCADPSTRARLDRQPYLNLLPRYRAYAALERDTFGPGGEARVILLSQNQVLDYWHAWRTEPQRTYLLPPTLSAARQHPEFRSDGTREKTRAALGLSPGTWTWLTSGVQPNTKGTDRVVYALAQFPAAQLLLAGLNKGDKAAQPVNGLARKLGVEQRLRWLGHREDMPQLMAAADLLLHPSRYDTTGTVILEGIVNGIPVIATQVCGYASHVIAAGAGEVVAEPFRQAAFNDAIRKAQDQTVSAAWSQAGIAYGQRPGLSSGRACAAQIIVAAANDKRSAPPDIAHAKVVDLATLHPAEGKDWNDYFGPAGR